MRHKRTTLVGGNEKDPQFDVIWWFRCGIARRWVLFTCRHDISVMIFLLAKGGVYSFGEGSSGQLGLGTNTMDSAKPSLITYFKDIKIKYTSCGENFTAAISGIGREFQLL